MGNVGRVYCRWASTQKIHGVKSGHLIHPHQTSETTSKEIPPKSFSLWLLQFFFWQGVIFMGPILEGSKKQQMYGNFKRFAFKMCCLGWFQKKTTLVLPAKKNTLFSDSGGGFGGHFPWEVSRPLHSSSDEGIGFIHLRLSHRFAHRAGSFGSLDSGVLYHFFEGKGEVFFLWRRTLKWGVEKPPPPPPSRNKALKGGWFTTIIPIGG